METDTPEEHRLVYTQELSTKAKAIVKAAKVHWPRTNFMLPQARKPRTTNDNENN